MKKLLFLILFLALSISIYSQDWIKDETHKEIGYSRHELFVGANIGFISSTYGIEAGYLYFDKENTTFFFDWNPLDPELYYEENYYYGVGIKYNNYSTGFVGTDNINTFDYGDDYFTDEYKYIKDINYYSLCLILGFDSFEFWQGLCYYNFNYTTETEYTTLSSGDYKITSSKIQSDNGIGAYFSMGIPIYIEFAHTDRLKITPNLNIYCIFSNIELSQVSLGISLSYNYSILVGE